MRESGATCLRTSFSHRCLGYMSCITNGLGVLSPVLPSFAWGLTEFTQTCTGMNIRKSQPRGSFFKQWDQQHWTALLRPFFSPSSMTSVFQLWLCTRSSAPHIAINNERVTRSMWPCKIQHNAASVTNDVIAVSPCELRVNVISIRVNMWCRFSPCTW